VEAEDALAAIEELERQHRVAEHLHAEFDLMAAAIPRDSSADADSIDRLCESVSVLVSIYRPHIQLENSVVFPVAARVLPAEVIQTIGLEMRERRRGILRDVPVART
jgi:hemerythrin-like domain-containing protein